jgi:hypothetical protein
MVFTQVCGFERGDCLEYEGKEFVLKKRTSGACCSVAPRECF